LTKRIGRLTKRIVRKQKELMKVLKRKHRTRPDFKAFYKNFEEKAYKLAKAPTPKKMTKEQLSHIENLKKKVLQLQKQHQTLVGEKQTMRFKIRTAKDKVVAKKAEKKEDKKSDAKKPKTDKKPSKDEKKEANKKTFKLDLAKQKTKAAKEHRHELRKTDRKVMKKMHAMGAEILRVSGVKFHRPSVLASLPKGRIIKIQERMQNKVKRAEKKVAKTNKNLQAARAQKDSKKAIKLEAKAKKTSLELLKRTARLASFKEKKLKNPKVKADAKLKKEALEKKNKYKN